MLHLIQIDLQKVRILEYVWDNFGEIVILRPLSNSTNKKMQVVWWNNQQAIFCDKWPAQCFPPHTSNLKEISDSCASPVLPLSFTP